MYACVDVAYHETSAKAACVTFEQWDDANASGEFVLDLQDAQPYVPGQFFQRELPCILSILEQLPAKPEILVVDGYVWLDERRRKGLGAHLFEALGGSLAIIGVAKTRFATATSAVEVFRGTSQRPLFVSAAGIDQHIAADSIRRMHGGNRIPTLLKRVDTLSRTPD